MKSLSPKMQMLAALGATRALVSMSLKDGWSDESPKECAEVLDKMMTHMINPDENSLPDSGFIQFAPTGPIQEIAISNGWDDEYMELSTQYDKLEKKLKLYK